MPRPAFAGELTAVPSPGASATFPPGRAPEPPSSASGSSEDFSGELKLGGVAYES